MPATWVLRTAPMSRQEQKTMVGTFSSVAAIDRHVRDLARDLKVVRRECSPSRLQWVVKDHATAGPAGCQAFFTGILFEATQR